MSPKMRRHGLCCLGLLWVLGTLGCSHTSRREETKTGGAGAGPKAEVVIEPEALAEGDVVLAAWLAYGARKVALFEATPPSATNQSADDFALELGAREEQSAFWAENRDKPHAVLDRQVEIWKAGFLSEMVLLVHGRPGWTIPAERVASLKLEEFVKRFAGDYRPGAPVSLKSPSGKLVPDVPGAGLPDPENLPIEPSSCPGLEKWDGAWMQWRRLEGQLDGVLAAETPIDFGRELLAKRADPSYAGQSITWVSSRVAHQAMLRGYCAVEAKDWQAAHDMLATASGLVPSAAMPRLELALALSALGRNREALAQVDRVLESARAGCIGALAWRRRGFVLFELGALKDARRAYETSLTLEPGSAVARDELRAIAEAVEGQRGASASPSYPPPPVELLHTRCVDGQDTNPAKP